MKRKILKFRNLAYTVMVLTAVCILSVPRALNRNNFEEQNIYAKEDVNTLITRNKSAHSAIRKVDATSVMIGQAEPLVGRNLRTEAIQKERHETLKKACIAWNQSDTGDNPDVRSIYSPRYNFTICDIYKCGYSSWVEAILVMEGIYTLDQYKKGKAKGDQANKFVEKRRLLTNRTPRQVEQLWKEIPLKVITVRHPFSRLLSAYNNKMPLDGKGISKYYGDISKRICKTYMKKRNNPEEQRHVNNGLATFEDFANFIAETKEYDGHWDTFDYRCHVCHVKYDFIMKFETMTDDVEYLQSKLNLSEEHSKAFFPHRKFKTDEDLVRSYYKKLPVSLLQKLYKRYKKDFDLFGYTLDF